MTSAYKKPIDDDDDKDNNKCIVPRIPRIICTLVFIINDQDHQILLGYKKRGWGFGLYNGFGGKVQDNENLLITAQREIEEECGLQIDIGDLIPHGQLDFIMPDRIVESYIYSCRSYKGELRESEEMCPRWFPIDAIPYKDMWADNQYWLPHLLSNLNNGNNSTEEKFKGEIIFDIDSKDLKSILITTTRNSNSNNDNEHDIMEIHDDNILVSMKFG